MSKANIRRKPQRGHSPSGGGDPIVIDEEKGLVFSTEDELYLHFAPEIKILEDDFFGRRDAADIDLNSFNDYEDLLSQVLEDPDEVWENSTILPGHVVYTYVGKYNAKGADVYYAALTYVTRDTPSFVYLHFPTRENSLIEHYRQTELIYDRALKDVQKGAIDGDALSEGDDLAVGLYRSMMTVRSEKDIPEDKFQDYMNLRQETIEEADEIWRSTDLSGNVLVSFIRESQDAEVFYIVVTVEDASSMSHALLFSFPTKDKTLVDRYRHGENLQADEIVQEASH